MAANDTNDPDGRALVDATRSAFPSWQKGTRSAHSHGIGATGWFRADPQATRLSRAKAFSGEHIPVLIRFSNGSGLRREYDHANDARGMAVKFFHGTPDEMDLVAMSMPLFMVRTGEDFVEFARMASPAPQPSAPSFFEKIRNALRLLPSPKVSPFSPPWAPNMKGLMKWAAEHPESRNAIATMANLVTPTSYARCAYHSVHTYLLRDRDDIVTPIRYGWWPTSGVRPVDDVTEKRPENYLHQELRDRLARGPAEFNLQFMLPASGDDIDDATMRLDHNSRVRVAAGRLVVESLYLDGDGCEPLSFNPTRLADGFEVSADPILQARRMAYEVSYADREPQAAT